MASKGWRPHRFEHIGAALRIARMGKRIPPWLMAKAAHMHEDQLHKVETGRRGLDPLQIKEFERMLGVPLVRRRRSKLERAP
uniref:HTH cro/C1-type domain-containing protein n=1 Tax=Pfiesteria piscicida TaxID=71001 RepID=A3E3Q2_PFIPI|nr:unknown [Pfiesteria piscicida]